MLPHPLFQLCSLFRLTTFDVKDLTSASWLRLNVNIWACNVHTGALATPLFDYTSSQYLTQKDPIQFRRRYQESYSHFHSLISSIAKWSVCCTCPIPWLEFHQFIEFHLTGDVCIWQSWIVHPDLTWALTKFIVSCKNHLVTESKLVWAMSCQEPTKISSDHLFRLSFC